MQQMDDDKSHVQKRRLSNDYVNVGEIAEQIIIKKEFPDIESVTHVPANETVAEERIRKLREKLRAKQAELDSFRKNIQSRSSAESETT